MSLFDPSPKPRLGLRAFGTACWLLIVLSLSESARADYAATVLSQKPVGYWRLGETNQPPPQPILATNLGSLGQVFSGSPLNGVIRGEPGVLTGTSDTSDRFTNPDWLIAYVGPYVDVPYTPALNPNGPFTVEFWAKPTSTPNDVYCTVCSLDTSTNGGNSRMGYVFYLDGPNQGWQMRLGNDSGYLGVAAGGGFTPNTWSHVVGSFTGSGLLLYVNGEQVAITNFDASGYVPNARFTFNIGMTTFPNRPFDGWIEEVAFYTNVLDPATIKAHFDAASTNGPAYAAQLLNDHPLGYWRLGEPRDPAAANLGSLGSTANGGYISPAIPGASGPQSPAFPGFEPDNPAVRLESGGYVSVPPLNLNTNTVTITAWVKTSGPQTPSAALLCNRWVGTQFGLVMDVAGGYGLSYNWNNDPSTINWDSGLSLADSDWAFVALAVQPSQAALFVANNTNYSTFAGATNVLVHVPQAFDGPTLFGEDFGDLSRFFVGAMDEVAIFNRTLSAGEIFSQYAAAVDGVPPQIFANPQALTNLLFPGDGFRLSVDAGGTPSLNYQWRKDGNPIAGATDGQYTKTNLTATDAGDYDVVVTNSFGSVTSLPASIQVSSLTPPAISQDPAGRVLYPGGTLLLTVTATGGTLDYQWQKDNQVIEGATNSTYLVPAVTALDAGQYVVTVTNFLGSVTSAPAVISVVVPAPQSYEDAIIADAPEAWWRLDDPAGSQILSDAMGRHDGVYFGSVALAVPGALSAKTNTGLFLDGSGYGSVPFSPALNPPSLTFECWAKTKSLKENLCPASSHYLARGCYFLSGVPGPGQWAGALALAGSEFYLPSITPAATMEPDVWTHLALTFDPTNLFRFYINGQWDGRVYLNFDPNVAGPLIIGARGLSSGIAPDLLWNGQLDEVAFYGRALSQADLLAHYAAARYGTNTPPIFKLQPQPQVAQAGSSLTLQGLVEGSLPIALQWFKDNLPVPNATNSTLTLTNLGFDDAGAYQLNATNPAGFTQSLLATLVVMPAPEFANLTNGLVAHLKFDNDFSDSSGNGRDATPYGSPAFIPGRIGSSAIQLTTATVLSNYSYVSLPGVPDSLFASNNNFSVSFWLSYTNTPDDLPILGNAVNSLFQTGWVLADHTGQLAWSLVDTNGSSVLANPVGGSTINDGNWHNVVAAFDRVIGVAATYIDGVLVKTRSITGLDELATGQVVCLGQDPTGIYQVDGTFNLDDLGIWQRPLTTYDAQAIYQLGHERGLSFDTYGPVTLVEVPSANGLQLIWQAGTLLQADSVAGPWTTVPTAAPPRYVIPPDAGNKFYRIGL